MAYVKNQAIHDAVAQQADPEFSAQDTRWIIENTGEEMQLFSSDFPHVEDGRNPLKRFGEALAGTSALVQRRFYRDNFIDLM